MQKILWPYANISKICCAKENSYVNFELMVTFLKWGEGKWWERNINRAQMNEWLSVFKFEFRNHGHSLSYFSLNCTYVIRSFKYNIHNKNICNVSMYNKVLISLPYWTIKITKKLKLPLEKVKNNSFFTTFKMQIYKIQ